MAESGTGAGEGVMMKPKYPVRAVLQRKNFPVPHKQMKNFMALKNKIIGTDQLITRFKEKVTELEKCKRQLVTLEKSMRGLQVELDAMHEENSSLKQELKQEKEMVEELKIGKQESDLFVTQLTAQMEEFSCTKDEYNTLCKEKTKCVEEKDKWKKRYMNMKKEYESLKARDLKRSPLKRLRRSSATIPLLPLISPPYLPELFEGAESLLTNSPSSIHSLPIPLTRPNRFTFHTSESDHNNCGNFDPTILDGGSVKGCDADDHVTHLEGHLADEVGIDVALTDHDGTTDKLNEERGTSSCEKTPILSEALQPSPPDDKDNHSNLRSDLFGDEGSDDDLSVSDSSSSCSDSSLSSVDDLAELLNQQPLKQPQPQHTEQCSSDNKQLPPCVSGVQLNSESTTITTQLDEGAVNSNKIRGGVCEMENGKRLTDIVLDAPAVKDDAHLENADVDDVAINTDLVQLRDDQPVERLSDSEDEDDDLVRVLNIEVQASPSPNGVAHTSGAAGPSTHEESLPLPDPSTHVHEQPPLLSPSSPSPDASHDHHTHHYQEVPSIEVVAADTASGEDSDMEVDNPFISLHHYHTLSPLPPSPENVRHTHACLSTPLSPLPPSPNEQLPLSPLPNSPLKSISPLPQSPKGKSPVRRVLDNAHQKTTAQRTNTSPLLFADSVPVGDHLPAPKPCSISVSMAAESSPILSPHSELRLSDSSPFSPPLPGSCSANTHNTTETDTVFVATPLTMECSKVRVQPVYEKMVPPSPAVSPLEEGEVTDDDGDNVQPSKPAIKKLASKKQSKVNKRKKMSSSKSNSSSHVKTCSFDELLESVTSGMPSPLKPAVSCAANTTVKPIKETTLASKGGLRKEASKDEGKTSESSPLNATPVSALPGYKLRSRNVERYQVLPKTHRKRSISSSSSKESPTLPPQKVQKISKEDIVKDNVEVLNTQPMTTIEEATTTDTSPVSKPHLTTKSDSEEDGTLEIVEDNSGERDVSGDVANAKQLVRQTDGATGQEEDRTPASSPKQPNNNSTRQSHVAIVTNQPNQSFSSACIGYGQPKLDPSSVPLSEKKAVVPSLSEGDDDVLNTPLPLVGKPQHDHSHTQVGRANHTPLSLAQQQLTQCVQCPLPIPEWLVGAMTAVQSMHEHCAASGRGVSRKKRGNAKIPIFKQPTQNNVDYIMLNLERMVCGHLHLSTLITMFTDKRNIPNLAELVQGTMKFLLEHYNPKTEHVVSLYHKMCDMIRGNPLNFDPSNHTFAPALLRPECQMVALFAHMCRMCPHMGGVLTELNKALYQAALKPGLKFHKLAALSRMFTAISRLQDARDRVVFFCYDLIKKLQIPKELPVVAGVASIWPAVLARRGNVELIDVQRRLLGRGLEQQPLSFTLEVVVMAMLKKNSTKLHESLPLNLYTLCRWNSTGKEINQLTIGLLDLLKTNKAVYIDAPPPNHTQWRRPSPSVLAFHIVHALRLLSWYQGWVWTNDTLIRAHLWPLLQEWNKDKTSVREATIVCIVRLIGFVSQQGLTHDPGSTSISQLQRVFMAFLKSGGAANSRQVSFPIQLAAVDSLFELCPVSHSNADSMVGVVRAWLKTQTHLPQLLTEFEPRMSTYQRPTPQ